MEMVIFDVQEWDSEHGDHGDAMPCCLHQAIDPCVMEAAANLYTLSL